MDTTTQKPKSKTYRIIRKAIICLLTFVVLATAFVYWYDNAGQQPDVKFDVSVKTPTFITEHPKLLLDVAHNNYHTPSGRYQPLSNLLQNDGYSVTENTSPFVASSLDSFQVLIIANAMGPDGHDGRDAFTILEDSVVVQ